ncbi:hypothetical protein BSKO_00790 [Bryopsis sp. KO-2023]|nr:hypothetical protein BSKO_00790 [Bryopsis sp. KO-2023]
MGALGDGVVLKEKNDVGVEFSDGAVYMVLTVPEVAALGSEAMGQDVQVFWQQEKKWADAIISNVSLEEEMVTVEYGFGLGVSLHSSQNCVLRFAG